MPEFISRPKRIKAEQWFPGKDVPGVKFPKPEALFTEDGEFYRVRYGSLEGSQWLQPSHRVFADSHQLLSNCIVFPGHDFVARDEPAEPLDFDDALFLNYALLAGWAKVPVAKPFVTTIQGNDVPISPGEWVVDEGDGEHFYPIAAEKFELLYRPDDGRDLEPDPSLSAFSLDPRRDGWRDFGPAFFEVIKSTSAELALNIMLWRVQWRALGVAGNRLRIELFFPLSAAPFALGDLGVSVDSDTFRRSHAELVAIFGEIRRAVLPASDYELDPMSEHPVIDFDRDLAVSAIMSDLDAMWSRSLAADAKAAKGRFE